MKHSCRVFLNPSVKEQWRNGFGVRIGSFQRPHACGFGVKDCPMDASITPLVPALPSRTELHAHRTASPQHIDTLFKALEARKIVIAETDRHGPVARCGQDEIAFQLRPRLKEVRQRLTAERDGGMAPASNAGESWSRRMYWSSRSNAGCRATCWASSRTAARA